MNHRFSILSVLLAGSLFLLSCAEGPTEPSTKSIRYSVNGTTGVEVNITISNEDDGTSQFSDVPVPWTYTFTAKKGHFLYVSAQNQMAGGEVSAIIYIDGKEWKRSSSSGAYVIASASGSCP